jgi:2-C-methyl-D-erythritol 2,4-cyclodiphosphate synthase
MHMRIGYGYDSHRFALPKDSDGGAEKPLVLGGVEFPREPGLVAHSDGDALVHAIIDALLGAAAMGDIGSLFPDTDPKWSGADSMKMLEAVAKKIRAGGYAISNIDATVICERPSIRGAAEMIRERLAGAMSIGKGRISVKGKTNEGMDDVGAGLGVAVHAVCLLEER